MRDEGLKVTIVLGLFVLAIFTVGAIEVYGERSTIEVPFDYHGTNCTFDQEKVIYTCTWQGSSETITKKGIQDAGEHPPAQILEQSKDAHELAVEEKLEIEQTEPERLIERIQDKIDRGTASDADLELIRVLEEVQTKCYFGIDEGRLIQKFQEFDLPDTDTDHNPQTNLSFKTNVALKKIYLLLEACEAWDVYKVEQLGAEYLNNIDDDSTSQGHHRDSAEGITPYNTHELTPEDYDIAAQKAKDAICGHSFYSKEFKQNNGCFPDPVIIPGAGIMVDSPAYRAYLLYKATDFVDLETLKKEQVEIALKKTADSFALEQGIDPADLKNWLAEQRDKHGGQK